MVQINSLCYFRNIFLYKERLHSRVGDSCREFPLHTHALIQHARTHPHTYTHKRARTHTHTHTHTRAHTHTHTRTRAHTHTHTHTHKHTHRYASFMYEHDFPAWPSLFLCPSLSLSLSSPPPQTPARVNSWCDSGRLQKRLQRTCSPTRWVGVLRTV